MKLRAASAMQPTLTAVRTEVYDRMSMAQALGRTTGLAAAMMLLPCAGGSADTGDSALAARLRGIETAFRSGDAGSLRPVFTSIVKVRVDLKDVMEGPGSYGPSQLEVIFVRIFDENRTRQFSFRDEDVTVSAPGIAFARGKWLRKVGRGGAETPDTVTFTLRQESGDWRIHEIRSSR
jgi:hypothetical protein